MKLAALSTILLLCTLMAVQASASNTVVIGGSGADLETFRILGQEFERLDPDCRINVLPSIGSGGAVRGVASGRVDIGLMSRSLMGKEIQHGLSLIHYAKTALVFTVAGDYPKTDIDTETLNSIYLGKTEVSKLRPILRPKHDSDTLILMQKMPSITNALDQAYKRKGVPIGVTDQSTLKLILNGGGFITTSTLALIASERPAVKVLSLNGIKPDYITMQNGSYPLIKQLYMVHAGRLSGVSERFVEFVRSDKGAEILKATGHVPINP